MGCDYDIFGKGELMKTATANFKTKANLPQGTTEIILAKIFYGTASSFLCSTRTVTIGADVYKPYVESFGMISYGVGEAPGLGFKSSCEIILKKKIFAEIGGGTENTVENLLTQKIKGKQVLLWQFFDDMVSPVLGDSDKLPLAIFVIDDAYEIEGGRIKLRCISPEAKIGIEVPRPKFDKATFPDLLESNLNLPRPILFGSFEYPFHLTPTFMYEKEYLFCNRPLQPLMPAFLIDVYGFIFLVHETTDATDISTTNELEIFEWLPEWNIFAFCARIDLSNPSYVISTSSGQTLIDMNALFNVTNSGRERYTRIMPSEDHFSNGASQWKNAVDLDDTTVCAVPASTNLMVVFDEKSALGETDLVAKSIGFYVKSVTGTILVKDGVIDAAGSNETEQGTITSSGFKEILVKGYPLNISSSTNATPIVVTVTAHGYTTGNQVEIKSHTVNTNANGTWIITKIDANSFSLNGSTGNGVGGATGTATKLGQNVGNDTQIPRGYYLKFEVGAGEALDINGLHLKIEFQSNKKPFATFTPPTTKSRTVQTGWHWDRSGNPWVIIPIYTTVWGWGLPPAWIANSGINNYFYAGRGVNFDTDTKGYSFESPVYFIQYLLRRILGYVSTEIQYTSFNQTNDWLTKDSGPAGEFSFWKFARCLNSSRVAASWLEEFVLNSACYLYWGGESGWHLFPINYASQITGILTFSDKNPNELVQFSRPILKDSFKLSRSQTIYNRFIFNIDFDYASGNFREQIIFDQSNKTELATSVTDYGEITYPIQDYPCIHRPELSISSSTNATPIVVTVPGHRFVNGNKVLIRGHQTNSNANGIWIIANGTTNTFELTGSAGNGVGGATGVVANITPGVNSQVNNLYSIFKRAWKDPRWIIEFETRLSASWLEAGDNFRINHPAASGITGNGGATLNDNTDFQIIEHRQTGNKIYIKAIEIVP